MLLILFRIAFPFAASLFCTYLMGMQLYSIAGSMGWFTAIPFWLLGIGIGLGCGILLSQGCVRALQWGGVIGAIALAAPLIAKSLGFALIVLSPFFCVYAFLQGAAARSGAKYRARLTGR